MPQTQIVTASNGLTYLNDGVLDAAPAKNDADRAVKIQETVDTVVPKLA